MTEGTDTDELSEIRQRKIEQLQTAGEQQNDPIHINGTGEFQDVLDDHALVLVDFYADWCGPCQMIEPIVERIAADTAATVAKVDVDANQPLAQEYGIRGIPALMLVRDGEVVERMTGVQEEGTLRSLVEQYAPA